MRIHVSPLALFDAHVAEHQPARIVSLLDPGTAFPHAPGYAERHLRLAMHDINEEIAGLNGPSHAQVEGLVDFLKDWDPDAPLYVHCWAGISRSTATAFTAACLHNPDVDEAVIIGAIRAASANARPNRRIVAIADAVLGRKGRMSAALDRTIPEAVPVHWDVNTPFHIPARFA